MDNQDLQTPIEEKVVVEKTKEELVRERRKINHRKYYLAHKDKYAISQKKYYQKKKDDLLSKQKEYYQNNKEARLKYQNEYNAKVRTPETQ